MYDDNAGNCDESRRIHNLFPFGVAVVVVSLAWLSAGQQADI
jgi:hypothetical protein